MKKFSLSLIIIVLFSSYSFAQITFQKAYGGSAMDEGKSVCQTFDGGFIIAGTTTSYGSGGRDVLVIKTDASGDTSWTKTFGGDIDNEYGFCVQQTADSGYILSGVASSFYDVAGDMYLIKLNALGDTSWTRTLGGIGYEWGSYVQQTSDGGYILAGQTPAYGAGGFDAYLIKMTPSATIAWTKTYGGTGGEFATAVQQTTDGGYIFTGTIDSYGAGSGDFYLVKTDSLGNVSWTKAIGNTGFENASAVRQTSDGGYIIAGTSEETLGPLGPDMCLIKTNAQGDTLWAKLYGGAMIDECYDAIETADGGLILCGKSFSFSSAGDYDVYVVKTNSLGVVQWSKTYGSSANSSANEIGYSIKQCADGGYIISGESLFGFGAGFKNIYLIKTDSLGNSGCNQGTAATITTNFLPEVNAAPTATSSGTFMHRPTTIVGSGTIQTNLCYNVISGVNTINTNENISYYPNPFTQKVNITLNENTQVNDVKIYNLMGQEVYSIKLTNSTSNRNEITLDLSALKSGIYACYLSGANYRANVKLVKD